jgi:hypothetical protein
MLIVQLMISERCRKSLLLPCLRNHEIVSM